MNSDNNNNSNNRTNQNNLVAILIGFGLIILAIIIIFWRFHISQNNLDQLDIKQNTAKKNKNIIKNKYSSIKVNDLAQKINANEDVNIIDLRDATDFEAVHIVGSQNIVLANLKKTINSLDKHKEYIIVDTLGITPSERQALKIFTEQGFKQVSYLEGGITQWENQLEPSIYSGNPYSIADQSKVDYINTTELQKLLAKNKKTTYLIDVRDSADFKGSHIPGAVNIELANLEKLRKQIPLDKRIIVYDNNGLLAFKGAVRLFGMRILNVSVLSDGFSAWKQKKLPVEKTKEKTN